MTGPLMTIYHDENCAEGSPDELDCWAEKDADIEVAVPVVGKLEVGDPKMGAEKPCETKVLCGHKGSYETLYMTYRDIFKHMMKSGMEIAGPVREILSERSIKGTA